MLINVEEVFGDRKSVDEIEKKKDETECNLRNQHSASIFFQRRQEQKQIKLKNILIFELSLHFLPNFVCLALWNYISISPSRRIFQENLI